MIQFECPGCSKVFTVSDEKAGKKGQCPQCANRFVIPDVSYEYEEVDAESETSPDDDDIEINPCPGCQSALTVSPSQLGMSVECPYCKTVYDAEKKGASNAPTAQIAPGNSSRTLNRPRKNETSDSDDDDEPRRRRKVKKRKRSSSREPDRSGMVLALVIIGAITCIILSIVGTMMASNDLRKMDEGIMDSRGYGMTRAAQLLGYTTIVLFVIGVLINIVVFVFILNA